MWTFEEWELFWKMLNSMPEFRCGEKPVAESVTFDGLSNGKRNTEVQASLYDAMMAEILDDRNAEKAKVRNRRKADRKSKRKSRAYIERNGGDFRCGEYQHGDKYCHYLEDLRMPERKAESKAESAERDWRIECGNRDEALAYHSDYLDMAIDHGERLEYLREQIRKLDYERMVIENYDREIKYEQNRVNELMRIAYTIMEGECY